MSTIAIMSPGEMGAAIGGILARHGQTVITTLADRGADTAARAAAAGIQDARDYRTLVGHAELVLSVLIPSAALEMAVRVATTAPPPPGAVYVDCNAVAPQTSKAIEAIVTGAGYRYVDGGIIGPPPRDGSPDTRLYVSGEDAEAVLELNGYGLDVRHVSPNVGDASALKMCYAAMTKGFTALATQLHTAAAALGVDAALREEFEFSQPALSERSAKGIPGMVPKAHRWVGEMREIAVTFEACGLSPSMFDGAAETYAQVAAAAGRRPEVPSFEDFIDALAEHGRRAKVP